MDLKQLLNTLRSDILPPLTEITEYCDKKDFIIIPVKDQNGWRAQIFKDKKLKKIGTKVFASWEECQFITYRTLYKAINK